MSENKVNIHTAILAVMNQVGYVQKERARNLNYSFASEAALIAALRPAMLENGIYCYVLSHEDMAREGYETKNGTAMTNTSTRMTVRFVHAPSETFVDVQSLGEGADAGDKSGNKAATCAYKYALRQTFLIETGDDPDNDQPAPKTTTKRRTTSKAQSNGKMSLEYAEDVKNRDGVRYGDLDTETLAHMATALIKVVKTAEGDELEQKQLKLDAAQTILSARAK